MALRAVTGGTGRVRDAVRTQGGGGTPPAPPDAGGGGGGGGGSAPTMDFSKAANSGYLAVIGA